MAAAPKQTHGYQIRHLLIELDQALHERDMALIEVTKLRRECAVLLQRNKVDHLAMIGFLERVGLTPEQVGVEN